MLASISGNLTAGVCPDGVQTAIDASYEECGGDDCFETNKDTMKATYEQMGCAGAAQTVPALFAAIAAVAGHFLN